MRIGARQIRVEYGCLTIPEVKSNHFFPSVVHTHVPFPFSMTRSLETLPIPGVMCLLPKSLEIEVDMVLADTAGRTRDEVEDLGMVRRIDADLNMVKEDLFTEFAGVWGIWGDVYYITKCVGI
jgi:hypothetical protein